MILWDVNLWVYAFRSDSPAHRQSRDLIDSQLRSARPFLLNSYIVASFLRLVTNSRIFLQPSPIEEAWDFVDTISQHPAAVDAPIDPMTLGIFKHITLTMRSGGNTIPDDLLAALAIRHDATLHTADTGFQRYAGLRLSIL